MRCACLCATLALGGAAHAAATAQWVDLDPELHRQGDRTSLEREGPWVQFTQRWNSLREGTHGEALIERMAVNCLTGAYGQTQYPATDPDTLQRILKTQSLTEIEHAQDFDGRLLLEDNATALGRALMGFACSFEAKSAGRAPTPGEMQLIYSRYIVEPLSKVEYHLHYLRLKSAPIAQAAIAEILAGKPFETVFDEHASPGDAGSFPHGDLGAQLETAFPIEDVRRFRLLNVGDTSRVPHPGLYGWEVVKLDAKRTIPAPSLATLQPRVQRYLELAQRCRWSP